jgi:hypothetical protein
MKPDFRQVLWMLSLLVSAMAAAAPVDDEDSIANEQARAAAARAAEGGKHLARDTGSPSSTVDLLIQLQDKTAGFDFKGRPDRTGGGAAAGKAAGPGSGMNPNGSLAANLDGSTARTNNPGAMANRAGLFGSGSNPVQARAPVDDSSARRTAAGAEVGRTGSQSNSSRNDDSALHEINVMLSDALSFLRENRSAAIGVALAALALIGGGTAIGSSRGKR